MIGLSDDRQHLFRHNLGAGRNRVPMPAAGILLYGLSYSSVCSLYSRSRTDHCMRGGSKFTAPYETRLIAWANRCANSARRITLTGATPWRINRS